MLINLVFDENSKDIDIIDIPFSLLKKINELQEEFFKWLFDKTNDHAYWIYKDNKKYCCSYRSEAFVFWLNNNVLNNTVDKAKVISQYSNELLIESPVLYF